MLTLYASYQTVSTLNDLEHMFKVTFFLHKRRFLNVFRF